MHRASPRNPTLRNWLRRVAIGLPLVAAPPGALLLVGWGGCGPCPSPTEQGYEIAGEDLARVTRGGGIVVQTECLALCDEFSQDIFPDGGPRSADAGVFGLGRPTVCRVDGEGDTRTLVCSYRTECGAGRRPAGLVPDQAIADRTAQGVGAWLAHVAHLELASVSAFEDLAAELRSAGAPRSLVERARCAADDEVRHAAIVGALASARGNTPMSVVRARAPRRSVAEMALDNAVEGCVREAYGALAAAHQAHAALDEDVRHAFASIARDEAAHGLLSEDIDAWVRGAQPQLRGMVEHARMNGVRELACELRRPLEEHERALGLPDHAYRHEVLEMMSGQFDAVA